MLGVNIYAPGGFGGANIMGTLAHEHKSDGSKDSSFQFYWDGGSLLLNYSSISCISASVIN